MDTFDSEYQTKKTPNNNGSVIFSICFVLLFNSYFNKFVASSGNTRSGLKPLASSISIKA